MCETLLTEPDAPLEEADHVGLFNLYGIFCIIYTYTEILTDAIIVLNFKYVIGFHDRFGQRFHSYLLVIRYIVLQV